MQGQVVQKLNDDIVLLEEKVLAQEAMLKSMRAERDKAQQETSSAIGWSETLAGEVIALENQCVSCSPMNCGSKEIWNL